MQNVWLPLKVSNKNPINYVLSKVRSLSKRKIKSSLILIFFAHVDLRLFFLQMNHQFHFLRMEIFVLFMHFSILVADLEADRKLPLTLNLHFRIIEKMSMME